jgi:hypothetical protein
MVSSSSAASIQPISVGIWTVGMFAHPLVMHRAARISRYPEPPLVISQPVLRVGRPHYSTVHTCRRDQLSLTRPFLAHNIITLLAYGKEQLFLHVVCSG